MKPTASTPSLLLVAITLLCLVVSIFAFSAATAIRRTGLHLTAAPDGTGVLVTGYDAWADLDPPFISPGSTLAAIAPVPSTETPAPTPVPLIAEDLTPEPDSLQTYAQLEAFYPRQSALNAVLAQPEIVLRLQSADGTPYTVIARPKGRPWWALPDGFWAQYLTGIAGALIAGWVWALRPRSLGPIMFAISAVALNMATVTSAIYANRGLAIDGAAFAAMIPINHAGSLSFGLALIGLFLCYPHRLVRPAWLLVLPAVLVLVMALDLNQIGSGPSQLYLAVALETLAILIAIALQYWSTRREPADRAALGWLGLSVAVGAGAYTILGAAPVLLHIPFGLPQSHVTSVLVIIYAGLALGLSRYRLFDLGHWAYRVLFFTAGALLLLLTDAALILLLDIGDTPALGASLLLVGFIYLPTRDWLWRRLTSRRRIEQHELFSAALDVAFAPSPTQSALRWRALLQDLFDPLEILDATSPVAEMPGASLDGLSLTLPATAGAPALRLNYPFAGRGLFSPDHLRLATQLVTLIERAEAGRAAYARGVGEERRRMARDLHDDVGARLLTGLHTADAATRPTLQAALSDIRAIVSGLSGDAASLDRVLAETRHETARRLEAAGIALDWPVSDSGASIQLDYRLHKALTSAVREIVSNLIRHADARNLAVTLTLTDDRLALRFADDGKGFDAPALAGEAPGYGLRNLRHRIEDIGGHLSLGPGPGAVIAIDMPLDANASTPDRGLFPSPDPLSSPP